MRLFSKKRNFRRKPELLDFEKEVKIKVQLYFLCKVYKDMPLYLYKYFLIIIDYAKQF